MSERPEHEIIITPPEAHSKKQALIYQAFKTPGLMEIWIAAATKFGKTLAASVAQISAGVERPGTKWRWVAPIYTQACIAMEDYFPKILPPYPHSDPNKSDLVVKLPSMDTTFEFWHAQQPSSLEGAAVHGYVFDEAARMKAAIRSSARTTTTRTKGPMMFISYPSGKNWFYQGCMEAKEHMLWSIKNNVMPERIFLQAKTSDNPHIDLKVIADAKRDLPDRLWRQFYLADFVDDGQVFTSFRKCLYGPEIEVEGAHQRWFAEGHKECTVVIGADWAKTTDWTVFIAADIETRRVIAFERFHRSPYTEACRRLFIFSRQFKSTIVAKHDKTGVGEAIDDILAVFEMSVEGVIFSNPIKADMVAKLMTATEAEGRLALPRWQTLLDEMDAYDVTISPNGVPTYSAPSGKHDDCVSALMLCNTALVEYGNRDYEVRILEDLPKQAFNTSPLAQYYDDLADDG